MLPGNPVRGLSTGERLRVDHLEVSSLHRDGTHRRCNHSRSQPLEVNNKQIHSNLKKNQSRERKNLWYFYDLNVMQESGGSQNAQKKLFYMRADVLCYVVCVYFYYDHNHLVRFHFLLSENILLCYPSSMNVMIVISSWKAIINDH